jgi:hypothetical protein
MTKHPRPDEPDQDEIRTYLINAEALSAMSSHFVAHVTTRQMHRLRFAEDERKA